MADVASGGTEAAVKVAQKALAVARRLVLATAR
jgi:hypothetical protein